MWLDGHDGTFLIIDYESHPNSSKGVQISKQITRTTIGFIPVAAIGHRHYSYGSHPQNFHSPELHTVHRGARFAEQISIIQYLSKSKKNVRKVDISNV
jgi:L-ribulose-5-phosphate 3-epimerase UlaE